MSAQLALEGIAAPPLAYRYHYAGAGLYRCDVYRGGCWIDTYTTEGPGPCVAWREASYPDAMEAI